MASLDNFHTGNGGKMRRDLYPDTRQRMQAIQMGLVSNTQWDLGNQVPVQRDQYRAKDTVSINHVTPRYTERLDANIKDLLVPTVPYTRRMRGFHRRQCVVVRPFPCIVHSRGTGGLGPTVDPPEPELSTRTLYTILIGSKCHP